MAASTDHEGGTLSISTRKVLVSVLFSDGVFQTMIRAVGSCGTVVMNGL